MCSSVDVEEFVQLSTGKNATRLHLALVVSGGLVMMSKPVCNQEGTFLARSSSDRARVVAALTALHEMNWEHNASVS